MRPQASIDITLRFIEAFDHARTKEGRGMKARFCRENGINCNQLNSLIKRPETRTLPPYYMACLCLGHGISADWILTGRGIMDADK
jgi:hypothetical protein